MKRIKKLRKRSSLHPILSFCLLILIVIIVSGILTLFDVTTSYSKISTNGTYIKELVSSENLFSSEALMNWEEILKNDPAYTDIADDGMFFEDINHKIIFKTNARIKAEGGKFNVDYFDWIQGVAPHFVFIQGFI